jgi:hypothetical protein
MSLEFTPWAKIPRLTNEEMTITEKIDGTNACVVILPFDTSHHDMVKSGYAKLYGGVEAEFTFATQSRKRFIKPGKDTDNAGFAAWAFENMGALIDTLGYGKHYGEWYGRGIQRSYGLMEKRFALFNPWRYTDVELSLDGLQVVPTLYTGNVHATAIQDTLYSLREFGSVAVPGQKAEGVIVQHKLSGSTYKAFVDDDGIPKSLKEGS